MSQAPDPHAAVRLRLLGASDALRFAAIELERYAGRVFGACPAAAPAFELGLFADPTVRRNLEEQGLGQGDWVRLGDEGYAIVTEPGRVRLYGARPRAVLYAVYDFLRDVCGCEFALSIDGVERVPAWPGRAWPTMRRLESPVFPERGFGLHGGRVAGPDLLVAWIDWLAKLKFNRIQFDMGLWEEQAALLRPRLAERDLDLDLGIHSLNRFLPEKPYAEAHPDWFASVTSRFGRQLRFSNLASVPVVVENALRWMERFPEMKVLGLWPLDGTGFDPAEMATGEMGDRVLAYVNAVAERLAAARPDLRFDHLAYVGYVSPPKRTRPHPAIVTSVCHYWDRDFNQPIFDARYGRGRWATSDAKAKAVQKFHPLRSHAQCCRDLAGWAQLGPTLVFNYYLDHNLSADCIHDLPPVILADLRYYRALGVRGSLACYCMNPHRLWFFRDLHALAEGLWNPDAAWAAREDSLLEAAFGAAGPAMRELYAQIGAWHQEPLLAGFRPADLLRGPRHAYGISGYNRALHQAVACRIDGRMAALLQQADAACAAAGSASARARVEAIRFNLEMQRMLLLTGCQVMAAFACRREGLEDEAAGWFDEAVRVFEAWADRAAREAPPGVSAASKIAALRPALAHDLRTIPLPASGDEV